MKSTILVLSLLTLFCISGCVETSASYSNTRTHWNTNVHTRTKTTVTVRR